MELLPHGTLALLECIRSLLFIAMPGAYHMEAIPDPEIALPVEGVEHHSEEGSPDEEPLLEALQVQAIILKSPTRLLHFFALRCADLEDHWKSLQSDEAFTSIKARVNFILGIAVAIAEALINLRDGFKSTGSVNYFDYTLPAPYLMLFATVMFAVIAIMISCLSALSWFCTNRHQAQEQLKQGGYHVVFYLLSIFAPMIFAALSLTCFVFGSIMIRLAPSRVAAVDIVLLFSSHCAFVWNHQSQEQLTSTPRDYQMTVDPTG
ncbi:hypothetical protein EDB19DRAFT_1835902 [Suillus lakei]|nr:hypothetical protein EDB19DRAFT_1835902 [Suillus lakei]